MRRTGPLHSSTYLDSSASGLREQWKQVRRQFGLLEKGGEEQGRARIGVQLHGWKEVKMSGSFFPSNEESRNSMGNRMWGLLLAMSTCTPVAAADTCHPRRSQHCSPQGAANCRHNRTIGKCWPRQLARPRIRFGCRQLQEEVSESAKAVSTEIRDLDHLPIGKKPEGLLPYPVSQGAGATQPAAFGRSE